MAIKITQKNGVFLVEGHINADTVKDFQTHFEFILNANDQLTINIEHVNEIDFNGVQALMALYTNAIIYNKKFYIVGTGCKEIYDFFQYNNTAA